MMCSVPDSPWNYLTIQLNRTSEDQTGDPDLYGSFFNSSQVSDTFGNTSQRNASLGLSLQFKSLETMLPLSWFLRLP